MERRNFTKLLVAASVIAGPLPSWAISWRSNALFTKNNVFTNSEIEILTTIVNAILPPVKGTGGLSVGVDKFLVKLFSDCYEKETHLLIKSGLAKLDNQAITLHTKPYSQTPPAHSLALFIGFNNEIVADKNFYNLIKNESIRGFNTSEKVMVDYAGYKVAPGHFDGSFSIK